MIAAARVTEKAVGQQVLKSVTPGQMVVKIVHDQLVEMLGSDAETIDLNSAPPVPILMVGLQGSGKTTTTAKIAKRLKDREKKRVLLASLLHGGLFAVESYLEHHAAKLVARFDAMSYVRLTQAMATHDVGRGRGGIEPALRVFGGELVVAAVDSDRLFPVSASADIVRAHGRGRLRLIHSPHGHDGFLIEADQIAALVREVIARPLTAEAGRVRPVA